VPLIDESERAQLYLSRPRGEPPPAEPALPAAPKVSQRARQKAETRARLLDAATVVFLDADPVTAPLDLVAKEAGVSRPTLFFHFSNRSELASALLDHHLSGLMNRAAEELVGDLPTFLRVYLEFQRYPIVRLIWQLGDQLQLENPQGPNAGYSLLIDEMRKRLVDEGLVSSVAAERALVLAPALMLVARRAAFGLTTEAEEREFIEAACNLALGHPTR